MYSCTNILQYRNPKDSNSRNQVFFEIQFITSKRSIDMTELVFQLRQFFNIYLFLRILSKTCESCKIVFVNNKYNE